MADELLPLGRIAGRRPLNVSAVGSSPSSVVGSKSGRA